MAVFNVRTNIISDREAKLYGIRGGTLMVLLRQFHQTV
jgi:hypothetical protein